MTRQRSGTGSEDQSPVPLYTLGLDRRRNAKPGLILLAERSAKRQRVVRGAPWEPPLGRRDFR